MLAGALLAFAAAIAAMTIAIGKAAVGAATAARAIRGMTTTRAFGYIVIGALIVGAVWLTVKLLASDPKPEPGQQKGVSVMGRRVLGLESSQ